MMAKLSLEIFFFSIKKQETGQDQERCVPAELVPAELWALRKGFP